MKTRIYLDLDGVAVDWVRGSFALHGKPVPMPDVRWHVPVQMGFASELDPAFWEPMENAHFWRNLDPLADGMELYRRIVERFGNESLNVLSSARCRCSADGKIDWLRKHMPAHVDCAVFAHKKERVAAAHTLLIDDYGKNISRFREAGGKVLLVPRPWNDRRDECGPDGSFDVDRVFAEVVSKVALIEES